MLLRSSEWRRFAVTLAYFVGLHRAPDASGLAHWTSVLAAGTSPDEVLASLVASSERWSLANKSVSAWVAGVYRDLLDGTNDPAGQAHWARAVDGGSSRLAVARSVARSAQRSNDYVADAYQRMLGITPTASSIATWSAVYRRTFLPREVLDGFASSYKAVLT
jgi:hypothetical protein